MNHLRIVITATVLFSLLAASQAHAAIAHEEAQDRQVESVEAQNRGFDLISRRPHPEDPATAVDVRFIEVKGRCDPSSLLAAEEGSE